MMSKEFITDLITNISNVLENRDNETLSIIAELKDADNILDVITRAFSSTMISNSAMKWKLPKDLHNIPNPNLLKCQIIC